MTQAYEVVNLGMSGLGTWADRILQHPMFPAGVLRREERGERREERGERREGRAEMGEGREGRGERREEKMEQWMVEEAMEDRMDCLHKLP